MRYDLDVVLHLIMQGFMAEQQFKVYYAKVPRHLQ